MNQERITLLKDQIRRLKERLERVDVALVAMWNNGERDSNLLSDSILLRDDIKMKEADLEYAMTLQCANS